ncbi:MAG TPA: hypothetical protein VK369_07180 [Segetibacter sp.]|nr:hypothetical protein [Segetibacter sp.]
MTDLINLLRGGDLRSIGQSDTVVQLINNQEQFDELFKLLFHSDRKIVMRSADSIEKISLNNKGYLKKHKEEILELCLKAEDKELKWHLALLVSRLPLTDIELREVWELLARWAKNRNESKIVRVNSLQALFTLLPKDDKLKDDFKFLLSGVERERIPSLNARIKKLKNGID